MRIVLATTAPKVGGTTRNAFDLAAGARRLGHEIVVASRRDATEVREAAIERKLPWQTLERSVLAPADVWHLHLHNTLDTRALPLLAVRRAAAGGTIIMTEHLPRAPRTDMTLMANLPNGRRGMRKPGAAVLKPALKRGQYRIADAVIAVSHGSADFMSRRWAAEPKWITTIHNGVEVPATPAPPRSWSGPMVVVAVGVLHWLKGFDVLLAAAARARAPWSLRIVGDGPDRHVLESQASGLPSDRQVEFAGWQSDAARASLDGDVLCAPSRAEAAAPYVVLEAMACARPVIASDVDGADEAIRHGENGLLVPPDDPERLAQAIDELALDAELRARMGRAGHARAASEFALGGMVQDTLALYRRGRA